MSKIPNLNPFLKDLSPYKAGLSIEEIRQRFQLTEVIKLGSNENPYGPAPEVIKLLQENCVQVSLYPEASVATLKVALANYYQLSSEEVFCGNGSDEVLLMIALAFLSFEDEALVSENTFSQYECVTRIAGAKVTKVPLTETLTYNLDGFAHKIKAQTKVIFLCNPNNPTGTYFSKQVLENFLNEVPPQVLVVVDEAYGEYSTAEDFPHSHSLLSKFPNLLVLHTFSKIYGLAGLRIGVGLGHQKVVAGLEAVRNFNVFSVNLLAQKSAKLALEKKDYLEKMKILNQQERNRLNEELTKKGYRCLPSQGNFICIHIGSHAETWYHNLLAKGIIVRWLKSFGLPDWVRVTVGTKYQNTRFLNCCGAAR